jgi:colicin import membrane protein
VRYLLATLPLALSAVCSAGPVAPTSGPARALAPSASAQALQATPASLSYAERVSRVIKPNIVLTEPIEGNPVIEVEVRTSPDGSIVGVTIINGSGVPPWDRAVQSALWKTARIPMDRNGNVPPVMRISFRPRGEP